MGVRILEKITVFGALEKKAQFFNVLQQKSLAHIVTDNPKNFSSKTDIDSYVKKLEAVLGFLEPKTKESFMQKNGIRSIDETEFLTTQKNELQSNLELINLLSGYISTIEKEKKNLNELLYQKQELNGLRDHDFNSNDLKKSEYVSAHLGKLRSQNLKAINEIKQDSMLDYDILSEIETTSYILLFTLKTESVNLLNLSKSVGFEEVSVNIENNVTFKQQYEDTIAEIAKAEETIKDQEKAILSYIPSINKLRLISDYINSLNETQEAYKLSDDTKYLFLTTLWIAQEDLPLMEQLIEEIKLISYEKAAISENEEVPALIRNNAFTKPFEFVTEMYSLPNKKDVDPTPYFAPFFPVFMGMCISDVGPSLILMLVSLFAIKKLNISSSIKKLMGVCFYGGLFGILFGVLTGTYFAIPFENYGIEVFRLYDPGKDILFTLALSIVFGYIHVFTAFCVQFYVAWINGDKSGAFFDAFTKILIMVGGLIFVLATQFNMPIMKTVGIYLFFGSVLTIWLTSGRHEGENAVSKLLWGAYGVYDLTGIFGDLLSYARLFALGLSGGIIASAINAIAPIIIQGISFDSILSSILAVILFSMFLLVLIFGHLFTMCLAFLSAFIHTLRLQFVEFFAKFFTGGSIPFKPLSNKMKYYQIKKNNQSTK